MIKAKSNLFQQCDGRASVYKSSVGHPQNIPLSFTGKRLLQNERYAAQAAIEHGDFNANDQRLSWARRDLAEYMSKLEAKQSDERVALQVANDTMTHELRASRQREVEGVRREARLTEDLQKAQAELKKSRDEAAMYKHDRDAYAFRERLRGSVTGRVSGRESIAELYNTTLMYPGNHIDRLMRDGLRGATFFGADMAQAEVRTLAWFANRFVKPLHERVTPYSPETFA